MSHRLPLLLVFTALVAGCTKEPPPTPVVRPVLTQVVGEARGGSAPAVYSGEVRPRYENDLAFRIGGKVVNRAVEVGSLVKRGQVLARLDPQDQQLQVQSANAQLAAADADVAFARAELERNKSLRTQNFISQASLDQKQQVFDAAAARIQQLRAQADVAKNSAGYTTLVADRDGVITAVQAEPGQVVASGQAVFKFARLDEREVLVNIPESRLTEWRSAPALTVLLLTQPDRPYQGRIREIAPTADATTRTFNARVSIVDADDNVRLGTTANVVLVNAQASREFVVPLGALGDREGKPALWIVDPKTLTVSPLLVEVGQYREDGVAIKRGLAGGETIVIAGVQKLAAGQAVRVAASTTNTTAAPSTPR